MFNTLRKQIILLIIIAFLMVSSGCSPLNPSTQDSGIPILPGDTKDVQPNDYTLYYNLSGDPYIAPEIHTIVLPDSKRLEVALLQELVAGPGGNLEQSINRNTRIVSVSDNDDVLFVTFSAHFLNPPKTFPANWADDDILTAEVMSLRRLSVYSVVNTITELGLYSSVQIYIDYDGNGTGQRPSRGELGFIGEDADQPIEPLHRNTAYILTPAAAIDIMMQAISSKDWDKVLDYTAFSPDLRDELKRQLELQDISLIGHEIHSETVTMDGQSAVVTLSYSTSGIGGLEEIHTNISLRLTQEDSIWNCSLPSLNQLMNIPN